MHLDIFSWLEAANLFLVDHISKDKLSGTFLSDSPVPGVDGVNALIQKTAEATRCTIMRLDISLNVLGGSDALLNSQEEALNFTDMFLFGCTVQVYA